MAGRGVRLGEGRRGEGVGGGDETRRRGDEVARSSMRRRVAVGVGSQRLSFVRFVSFRFVSFVVLGVRGFGISWIKVHRFIFGCLVIFGFFNFRDYLVDYATERESE